MFYRFYCYNVKYITARLLPVLIASVFPFHIQAADEVFSAPYFTKILKRADAFLSVAPDSSSIYYQQVILEISPFLNEISDPFTDPMPWYIYGKALSGMGEYYFYSGDYAAALSKYFDSQSIFEATGNIEMLAYVNLGIGRSYRYYGPQSFQNAIICFLMADSLFSKITDNRGIALANYELGLLFSDNINHKIFDPKKAQNHLEKALMIQTGLNAQNEIATVKSAMANVYAFQGQYEPAINFINDVLKYYYVNYSPKGLYHAHRIAGNIYFKMKVYKKALEHSFKALEQAEKISFLDGINNASEQISEIYYALKQFDKAYDYYHLSVEKKFQILSSEKIRTIEEMRTKYEIQKKENLLKIKQEEIESEKIQKQYLIFAIIMVSLFIIIVFILYRLKVRDNRIIRLQNQEILKKEHDLQKQAEHLTRLNLEKDKFFSIIAHDLRNPFNHLIGFTKVFATNLNDYSQEDLKKIAGLMHRSTILTYNLLENLLLWANSQKGSIPFNLQEESLHDVAQNEISLLNELAGKKEISILNDIPESIVLRFDVAMIRAVFRNLISNAIKFTHKHGLIRITAIPQDGFYKITVSDNGIGIDHKLIPELLTNEINKSQKGTESEDGSGLGLALCREFISKHGGNLYIESEIGKGSNIIFTLPENLN